MFWGWGGGWEPGQRWWLCWCPPPCLQSAGSWQLSKLCRAPPPPFGFFVVPRCLAPLSCCLAAFAELCSGTCLPARQAAAGLKLHSFLIRTAGQNHSTPFLRLYSGRARGPGHRVWAVLFCRRYDSQGASTTLLLPELDCLLLPRPNGSNDLEQNPAGKISFVLIFFVVCGGADAVSHVGWHFAGLFE